MTAITVTNTNLSVVAGKTLQLSVNVQPNDAFDKSVTYASKNEAVATVSDTGLVTGVKAGTADITVTAKDGSGVTATITVTVTAAPTLGTLTVAAAAREGGQTVTVTEAVEGNNLRRYKITDAGAKPTIAYDTACVGDDGWLDFPSNGEVSGTEGQVITVVELTNSGANARKVGTATLPAPAIGTLTVAAAAREGGQTVTVTEAVEGNNLRRYKITDAGAKPTIAYDTACVGDDGWLDFPSNGEVSGTEGQVITVVELTNQGSYALKVGTATLPAPTASK